MSFPKPKFGKKNKPTDKADTKPVISDKITQKDPSNKADIQTPKGYVNKANIQTSKGHANNDDVDYSGIQRAFFFKRLVNKKLTILLIENTSKVVNEKENLIKIVKSLISDGLVSVISYGTSVKKSEIVDFFTFNSSMILCDNNTSDMACLYDALVNLESLISKKYMLIEENETERVRINKIEVIGIGTCKDNCSKASKEVGIDSFYKVLNKTEAITKYFCLTEETFMDAAEIGFRSIGAILRNY